MAERVVRQTNVFLRVYKKSRRNQKEAVDQAVEDIVSDPAIGEEKISDLSGIYVYKFDCVNQRFLLAYEYDLANPCLAADWDS